MREARSDIVASTDGDVDAESVKALRDAEEGSRRWFVTVTLAGRGGSHLRGHSTRFSSTTCKSRWCNLLHVQGETRTPDRSFLLNEDKRVMRYRELADQAEHSEATQDKS